jgi:uncharacterized phage protein (TIGR02218 family)
MKPASSALITYLNNLRSQNDVQAIAAECFTLTLRTGLVLTYTNAGVPITLNGYLYAANSVLIDGLKYKCQTGLDVDQQKITISARSTDTVGGVPFLQALRNGVFDGCLVKRERAFLNSWSPLDCANPIGSVVLFQGRMGTIDNVGRTTAEITVNSDLALLDIQMPRNLYMPTCNHVLYDSGCGLVKNAFGANGSVGSGSSNAQIVWSSSSSNYEQGTITFTSGVNNGVTANIKSADSGNLYLSYPLLQAPATGDTFTAYQGCDHTMSTCQSKFNNLTNFRGFPFVPGAEQASIL